MTVSEEDFQWGGTKAMMRCTCGAKYLRLGYKQGEFRDWYSNTEIPQGKCIVCGVELEKRYLYLLSEWSDFS